MEKDTAQIRDEVFAATQAAYEKAGFTAEKIAKEVAKIAFSDIKDYVTVEEDGSLQFKPFSKVKTKTKAIKKLREKTTITESADGSKINKVSNIEIELWDKLGGLEMGIDVLGHKRPAKIDVNHSGSFIADLVEYFGERPNENTP